MPRLPKYVSSSNAATELIQLGWKSRALCVQGGAMAWRV